MDFVISTTIVCIYGRKVPYSQGWMEFYCASLSSEKVFTPPPLLHRPDVLLLQKHCDEALERQDIFLNSQKEAEILLLDVHASHLKP